jgi:hypothetical protein
MATTTIQRQTPWSSGWSRLQSGCVPPVDDRFYNDAAISPVRLAN